MRLQGLEEHAEPAVDQRDGAGVGPPEPEQLGLVDHVADRAGGYVDQDGDLLEVDLRVVHVLDEVPFVAGLELVGLGGGVLVAVGLGRVPGAVRAEQVEPEQERVASVAPAFEPVDRRPDRPCDPGVLLDLGPGARPGSGGTAPSGLSRARDRDRRRAGAAGPARPASRTFAGAAGRRAGRAGRSPGPRIQMHLVEPAAESPAGLAEQRDVGDQGRVNPLVPEQVGQDQLVVPERGPALRRGRRSRTGRSTSSAGSAAW